MNWLIRYENDKHATIRVTGDRAKAERIANKRNKYGEAFTITEAPRVDRTLEKEIATREAMKYGAAVPPQN